MTLQPHDQAHFEPEGFRPTPTAHNADAALREAVEALEYIAKPATRLTDDGGSTICLRCGMETFHEKDGEVVHERDCVQQYAAAALSALRSPATGETHDPD